MAIKSRTGRLKLRQPLDLWLPAALESSGFGMLSDDVRRLDARV